MQPQELQPQLWQPQPQELQPQPLQPQVLTPATLPQQRLQQELTTKSGNVMPFTLLMELQELQELQAMGSPPKEECRGGVCLHDILCAYGSGGHSQPSKIMVSSKLTGRFLPKGRLG